MESLDKALEAELAERRRLNLYRSLCRIDRYEGNRAEIDGRELVILGSNNYLGLAQHPEVVAAAAEAARRWGVGATGSRLTTGNLALHEDLERQLAAFKQTEAALLFPSGYQANIGIVCSLMRTGDLIVSDELNHASIIDACRLSRAEVRIYRHCDASHARALLTSGGPFRRRLLVTDGVFSMDGDMAPLKELCELCEEAGAWLMVDDAHGLGVLGASGAGTAELAGVQHRIPIQMGTLSKALGSSGGYVAGSQALIDTIINTARSFIFSTALPAPAVAAGAAALGILRREPSRAEAVRHKSAGLRKVLREMGLAIPEGITAIIPVIIGDACSTIGLAEALRDYGVMAPAIRPPSVPEGAARIRVSVMATHTSDDLEIVRSAFESAIRQAG